MRLTPRAIRGWDIVHTWSSLACTGFMLILCVTGLPLIFSDEIAAASRPPAAVQAPVPGRAPWTLDRLVAHVHAAYPREFIQFIFWDEEQAAVGVGLAGRPDAPLDDIRRILFDAHTGAQVAERPPETGPMQTVLELHESLLAGPPGELFLAAVAAVFILSLLSGVVLYAPFLGDRAFGAVRPSSRPRWIDLHNLAGIAIALWLSVVGVTGLFNTLEGPLFGAWQDALLPGLLEPSRGKPFPARLSSVDAAIETAKAAAPGMTPTSIGFPYSLFGSPRHYLVWMKGKTPVTAYFFTPVLVDASDGRLAAAAPLPWYLRIVEICRPLHFGDYGGLPLKIVWTLLDLMAIYILAGGLHLFMSRIRRRRHGAPPPDRSRAPANPSS